MPKGARHLVANKKHHNRSRETEKEREKCYILVPLMVPFSFLQKEPLMFILCWTLQIM